MSLDDPYASPRATQYVEPALWDEPTHSGFGIASFVISIIVGVGFLALFGAVAFLQVSSDGVIDESSPIVIVVGLGFIFGMCVSFAALVMGIVGVFQANRKKIFAILGIAFNALIVLGVIGLMVIGLFTARAVAV